MCGCVNGTRCEEASRLWAEVMRAQDEYVRNPSKLRLLIWRKKRDRYQQHVEAARLQRVRGNGRVWI